MARASASAIACASVHASTTTGSSSPSRASPSQRPLATGPTAFACGSSSCCRATSRQCVCWVPQYAGGYGARFVPRRPTSARARAPSTGPRWLALRRPSLRRPTGGPAVTASQRVLGRAGSPSRAVKLGMQQAAVLLRGSWRTPFIDLNYPRAFAARPDRPPSLHTRAASTPAVSRSLAAPQARSSRVPGSQHVAYATNARPSRRRRW